MFSEEDKIEKYFKATTYFAEHLRDFREHFREQRSLLWSAFDKTVFVKGNAMFVKIDKINSILKRIS